MIPHYVLIIHGIGEEKAGFSEPLPKLIGKEFAAHVTRIWQRPPQDEINITEVVWADITQNDQNRLWDRLFPELGRKGVSWGSLLIQPSTWIPRLRYLSAFRRFVVNYLGDHIAYVKSPGVDKYEQIHQRVWASIDQCASEAGQKGATDQKPALLTIVAHSLGSVIACDLSYDSIIKKKRAWPSQLRLANLITMGSPLALYTLRFGDPQNSKEPITMQDPNGLRINIYDPQDILGYPLKLVNRQYDQAVDIDKVINAGQWWKFWQWIKQASPFSHLLYWEDSTVAEVIGRKAALDWLRENQPELGSRLQQEYAKYKSWLS
jgi:hypothetical protein